jgi:cytochrome P450
LAKHQEVQDELYAQLHEGVSADYSSWEYAKVKTISYIDDIINETLRLKPRLLQGMPREIPPQGIHIGDKYVPGHVVVSVPTMLIQCDSRWWKQPDEFIPARWSKKRKEMGTDDGPWLPFQMGESYTCADDS